MNVIVFGMENCAGCVTVKNILEHNGVEFTKMDVMNPDHMADAQKYGVRSVPTTVVNDVTYVGASEQVLKQIREVVGI